jgi:hypothetical protein
MKYPLFILDVQVFFCHTGGGQYDEKKLEHPVKVFNILSRYSRDNI